MFSLIVFGAISLNRLGVSQMPDVDFPILSISVTYEGAAPEIVESELIDPLEERLLAIEGIKEMRSSSQQGSGRINLEFDITRNIDVALQEAQSAISQYRFPPGVDPPVIRKQNPEEDPIMYVSIYGEAPLRDMLDWTQNYLLDQLQFLPGIGEVGVGGFSERNLRIWIDPRKLEQNFLSISDVIDALKTQHIESAAGQFSEGKRELRVRWLGEASQIQEVENIRILSRGGQIIHNVPLRIKDVARVEDGLSDIRRIARFNGKQAVAIQIRKQRGTNEIDVANAVQKKLKELKDRFPPGYGYQVNIDFTRSTKSTVDLTKEKLWVAALITILVCFLFLGSIPAAVNILFSIPTSIVGTFLIVYFSHFTLNLFTLLALTLAISIVVDDAIMLLENIVRHYRMGKGSAKAASDGSKEVLPAAAAATLAVIAVFLPVIFMGGVIGKFFFQFGVTMSSAVLLSLLEAVTITPMRAAAFLSSEPKVGRFEQWLDHKFEGFAHSYQNILRKTIQHRWRVLLASTAFFIISLILITRVRQEFVPAQDQNFIIVTGVTTPGSSLESTDTTAKQMEEIVKTIPEVDSFISSVGAGGASSQVNSIFMPLALKPKETRKRTHTQVMDELRKKMKSLKDVRISMRDISARNLSSGRANPLAINIRGSDLVVLNEKSQELIKRLEAENLAVDLDTDYRTGIPELVIAPNREQMALKGVSVQNVGTALAAAVGGLRQGRYTNKGERYDIRFKIEDSLIHSASDIGKLYVRNIAGNLIRIDSVAEIRESQAAQSISRVNRQRSISIFGNLAAGQSQAKVLDRAQAIAKEILPQGYAVGLEGAAAGFSEAFGGLFSALMIGILVAYLILAIQFNSFIHPIAVLMSLPFSVTGALIALWLFGASLNLFSFIGLIVLMGIAKKNAILLVEFTNQIRKHEKLEPIEALIKACPVRLRPIIMTSVATVAAATPLIIGNSIGSETRLPMGLSIVGGTIVSTILTLFVVPSIYLVLTRFESKKKEAEL